MASMLPRLTTGGTAVLAIVFGDLQRVSQFGTTELCGINRNFRFLPWILIRVHSLLNLSVQSRAYPQTVFDQNLSERFYSDSFGESVRSLQVFSVFAVVLHESPHIEENVIVRIDGAEKISLAHAAAGSASDIDLSLIHI